jgi:hypothetical protein
MRARDLTGERFGRLIATAIAGTLSGKKMWHCVCDCGIKKVVRGSHLTGGKVESCGCLRDARFKARNTTHGMSKQRPYRIWRDMINRCHYEKYPERHLYGGRGISVCQRWRDSFVAFIEDMGLPPPGMSIDRYPNNDGNYEPGNCRWATATQQARNRRRPATAADRGVALNEPISANA